MCAFFFLRGRQILNLFGRRYCNVGILVLASAAVFSCVCSAQVTADVGLGSQYCRQVDVPGVPPFLWSIDPATAAPGSLNRVFQPDDLNGPEFRTARGNLSELYFAAIPMAGLARQIGPYSKEKYVVSVHGLGPVRAIGEQEWRLANTLAHFKELSQPDYHIEDDDNKNISYKGKEFRRSGEHLSFAIVSANGRWIAVFSYDGKQMFVPPEQRGVASIGIPAPTKHPKQGELYCDIYDVGSGLETIAMKGSFQGDTAGSWFLTAFFLEDRYFFLNTGEQTDQVRQFWLCALP